MAKAIATLALAAAIARVDGIAPPLDQPVRYALHEERVEDGVVHRFTAHRALSFHVTPDGFEVDVLTRDATAEPRDLAATLYLAAMAPIDRQPLRCRIDRQGHVTAIIDQDASWRAITAAVGAMASSGGALPAHNAAALAHQLATLPPEAVRALLASTVETLMKDRASLPSRPDRRVLTVPMRLPSGQEVALAGVEDVAMTPDQATLIDTASSAGVDYRATRAFDRASGLLVSEDERRTVSIASGGGKASVTVHLAITRE